MSGTGSWTEELKIKTGVDFMTTNPGEIEQTSLSVIRRELGDEFLQTYPKERLPVLCRVIHATADFSYRDTLCFSVDFFARTLAALKMGLPIITDTTMAASGINKRAAAGFGCEVYCFIGDPDVAEQAGRSGMTRSAVSVDKAAARYPHCIYVVGNAPTALMRLYERIADGGICPELVIGVPVGFVNVIEAKELILRAGVPYIVTRGRRGGSNVAAAICNALLYEAGKAKTE